MIISDGINHGKLQTIIVGELKKAGLKHRLKKIILKSVKDNKTVFGAQLIKVPSCSVICCGSTLSIPLVVSEMSTVLRANAHIEGLFRKAGSQTRQKDIKRLLDAGGCVSDGHHPIDVASVLKLYLRCLPEPLISAEVQDLLLRCKLSAGDDALKPLLHTLLLLPVLHVHLLHYIMELLNFIASRHKENLMDSSNLAIVMTPSIMPLPAASSAQRLEHHVELVKIFIENAKHIGILTEELMSQLDDDTETHNARRKKRRSGSLNRVLNGLRKMVSGHGSTNTPATIRENKTPVLSKSASKRKFDNYEGLSNKTKKVIKENLPQKDLSFTPMKVGLERKRLRLSLVDARSTPVINANFSSHINSETSGSSNEDLLASSELLFSAHDTIDLSPDMKQVDKDYVRISKQEYEEIKSRVSAIENRLSMEFTDVVPKADLHNVQSAYEQTLEEVAMLHNPTSDQLARRLSRELKIRPNEQVKIIRSPSARKIGNIRRRSKENVTKLVRHKSWNVSTQSNNNFDRFYPYTGLRERTSTANSDNVIQKSEAKVWNESENQKYQLRKRASVASDYNLNKTIGKSNPRRSLNITVNNQWDCSSDNSTINITLNNSESIYQNVPKRRIEKRSPVQHKWKSAAAFFMDRAGEVDNSSQTGRPSVNKLRKQNAGAVLAKAKLFESSSDKSSDRQEKLAHTTFARKPRINSQSYTKTQNVQTKTMRNTPQVTLTKQNRLNANLNRNEDETWRANRKTPSPMKKVTSPQTTKTSTIPSLKKPLCTPRSARTPITINDSRKINTPMKAVHISPRRRSPRHKQQRYQVN